MNQYCVYILFNASRMLYVGVTNDLMRRMSEHRQKLAPGYAARYNLKQLAYYEAYNDVNVAIAREKELKGWRRERKVALIEAENPEWRDLCEEWFQDGPRVPRHKGVDDAGAGTQSAIGPSAQSLQDPSSRTTRDSG